jgi:metal-responsive CopG/Arc/MetJ family transcriptional regulator
MKKQPRAKSVGLRIDEALRKRLEGAARANKQSLNSEMVRRLAKSFQHADELKAKLAEIEKATSTVIALQRLGDTLEAKLSQLEDQLRAKGSI